MKVIEIQTGVGLGNVSQTDRYVNKVRMYDGLAVQTYALRLCAEESCQDVHRLIALHGKSALTDGVVEPEIRQKAIRARAGFLRDLELLNMALDTFACAVEEITRDDTLPCLSATVSKDRFQAAFDALAQPIELRVSVFSVPLLTDIRSEAARMADRHRSGEMSLSENVNKTPRYSTTAIVQSWRTLTALAQSLDVGPNDVAQPEAAQGSIPRPPGPSGSKLAHRLSKFLASCTSIMVPHSAERNCHNADGVDSEQPSHPGPYHYELQSHKFSRHA